MPNQSDKPKVARLYLKTYLQMVRNAVGTNLFRNFYITVDGKEMDSLGDGFNSCAFFVSSVLVLFKKHQGVHGTIASVLKDLEESGWQVVAQDAMQPGDVIRWEEAEFEGEVTEHVGFYVGDGRAVSNSAITRQPVEHDAQFDGTRAILQVFRHTGWDEPEPDKT